ncbi:primosomal protein N' [Candidatus Omnitrophota bacterium]
MNKPPIAKVAVPLPIDKLFDYYVPRRLFKKVKKGMRVAVSFNNKVTNGYVISLGIKSKYPNLRPVLDTLDDGPAFTNTSLRLAESIKNYYACSLGEIIETMLPHALKHSKDIKSITSKTQVKSGSKEKGRITHIQYYSNDSILNYLKEEISLRLKNGERVIFIVPETRMIEATKGQLEKIEGIKIGALHGKLSKKDTLRLWNDLSQDLIDVVIGTRSCIFTPIRNLGLIVINGGTDYSYKEDQVPYYHAFKVAQMRSDIQKCDFILTSQIPSIETYQLISKKKVISKKIGSSNLLAKLQITSINFQDKIDKVLENELAMALEKKEKVLILLDRKGFATSIFCKKCNETLRCDRCSCNLRFEYSKKMLICPRCEHKIEAVEICPKCNSAYVKFRGLGIEKLESNIKRHFPSAKIISIDQLEKDKSRDFEYDILVSTRKILNHEEFKFDVTVIWDFDSLLNIGDFRSGERAYQLLAALLLKSTKKMIICSSLKPDYYLFKSLVNLDYEQFYNSELKSRRVLNLPPYYHMGLISIRSHKQERSQNISLRLFDCFNRLKKSGIEVSQLDVPRRSKIRGKYYNYLLIKSKDVATLNRVVKKIVNKFKSGNIIITVNIDPI